MLKSKACFCARSVAMQDAAESANNGTFSITNHDHVFRLDHALAVSPRRLEEDGRTLPRGQ